MDSELTFLVMQFHFCSLNEVPMLVTKGLLANSDTSFRSEDVNVVQNLLQLEFSRVCLSVPTWGCWFPCMFLGSTLKDSAMTTNAAAAARLRKKRALVVVDMSVEQMSAVSYRAQETVHNCCRLVQESDHHNDAPNHLFDLKIDSKLWLTSPEESTLSRVWPETAKSMFVAHSEGASLVPELRQLEHLMQFCPKNNYSCFANSNLKSMLDKAAITDVYICGINTDYCVFATALDSFQQGYNTYVVQDAVTSVRGRAAHEEGLSNLVRHFGEQVLKSTDEVLSNHSDAEC